MQVRCIVVPRIKHEMTYFVYVFCADFWKSAVSDVKM